jgi:hypothetical protein
MRKAFRERPRMACIAAVTRETTVPKKMRMKRSSNIIQ